MVREDSSPNRLVASPQWRDEILDRQPQIQGLGAGSLQSPSRGPGKFSVAPMRQRCCHCVQRFQTWENNIANLALKEWSTRQNLAILVKSAASLPEPSNRGAARPTVE